MVWLVRWQIITGPESQGWSDRVHIEYLRLSNYMCLDIILSTIHLELVGPTQVTSIHYDLYDHLKAQRRGNFIQANHNDHVASIAHGYLNNRFSDGVPTILYLTIDWLIKLLLKVQQRLNLGRFPNLAFFTESLFILEIMAILLFNKFKFPNVGTYDGIMTPKSILKLQEVDRSLCLY